MLATAMSQCGGASATEVAAHDQKSAELAAYLMYPKVYKDFAEHQKLYGDVSALPTPVFFYGMQEQQDEISVEDRLNEVARQRTRPGQAVWGTSALVSDGILVRGLSMSGRFMHETLIEFWKVARKALTGEDAVPPRKNQ